MRAESVYRALLYCYPAAFRHEYGSQMRLMFFEQLGEARRTGGPLSAAALWLRAAWDALTIAPQEHAHVIHHDLRFALRAMAAQPGFTAIAVLSLALGIGANTALFTLWNGVLHASLPGVREPRELVTLSDPNVGGMWTGRWIGRTDGDRPYLTYEEFEQLRDHGSFSSLMASQTELWTWQVRIDNGLPEEVHGRLVSAGFFQTLGVNPILGRAFTASEEHAAAPYAVISHDYWQRRFGGRPDILGKVLTMPKAALTIIGVTPPDFVGETMGQRPDLWIPLQMQPRVMPGVDRLHDTPPRKVMWLRVFGRLQPGVTTAQAEAQSNAVFQAGLESFYGPAPSEELHREYLDQHLKIRSAVGGASETRGGFSTSLTALLAAVGVLLLIACANLANLLLARGAARKPEIALRLSLGASRGRLIRQLLTESIALAAAGGLASLALAYMIHSALVRLIQESDRDFRMTFTLNPLVLGFALALTLTAALLFGLLPAWQVTATGPGVSLQEQSRGSGSLARVRWGRWLVSLQLALSVPLLVGAGLLARTIYNLQHVDLGFSPDRLVLVRFDSSAADYDDARRHRLVRDALAEFQRIPGVRAATFSRLGIFSGGNTILPVEVQGYSPKEESDRRSSVDVVAPGYFSTLGVPILRGRELLAADRSGAPGVCVVNEVFARHFFASRDPLGRRVTASDDKTRTTCTVVGVVRDARTQGLRGDIEPRLFLPSAQSALSDNDPVFLIRSATAAAPVIAAARKIIQRSDPSLSIDTAQSVDDQMAPLMAQDRTTAQIAIVFGCVALTIAAIGLYGLLSYGVARRSGEIAIRMALGARPGRVVSMILRETCALVMAGLVVGAGLAWAASRLIAGRLYGVPPEDPLALALAVALLVLVALGAAYLPARRASRLDPIAALRHE